MTQSVEQLVCSYRDASAAVRKKYNTRAKARQFLVKAGILEKHASSRNGVRLAKPYR
ncbi:MAG TPA: hypothetical protein VFC78_17180 [Tepidisphaeraceae bacterium]|nr:hypothetical protein [Tepidisphaeraceae bacterium]